MMLVAALLVWTLLFAAVVSLFMKKWYGRMRVYWLIFFNALFLCGVFWFFPLLKGFHQIQP